MWQYRLRRARKLTVLSHLLQPILEYTYDPLLEDHAYFVQLLQQNSAGGEGRSNVAELHAKVDEQEKEVKSLKAQLNQAIGINDTMWESIVKGVLSGNGVETKDSNAMDL